MRKHGILLLIVAGALALAGAVVLATVLSVREGTGTVVDVTLAFTIVAALGALLGALITLLGNRVSDRRQRELAAKQREMAGDIRRLAELAESSIEKARAQRPEPVVHFLVGKERTPADAAILERKRLVRELDIEAIVAGERQAALATLPSPKAEPKPGRSLVAGAAFGEIFRNAERIGSLMGGGPITEQDRKEYAERVDRYARDLRDWLAEYKEWREQTDLTFVSALSFENRGRVPARDVRVQLHFPDQFEEVEEDGKFDDRPPRRPRFQRRTLANLAGLYDTHYTMPDVSRLNIPPIGRSNVSSPRYRKGSLVVEVQIDKLLHGIAEETDEPVMLRVEEDGEYTIPWEVHAENLVEPTRAELTLKIITEAQAGSPITSLDELLVTALKGGEEGSDAEK
jgi:hypothetical protein